MSLLNEFKFKRIFTVVDVSVSLFGYGPQFFFMLWPESSLKRCTVTLRGVHIGYARLDISFRWV